MNKEQLQQELMQAVDGLLVHSEIDAPFEFVYLELRPGKGLEASDVAEYAGKPSGMKVDVVELEEFLQKNKSIVSDARESTPGGEAGRRRLAEALRHHLEGVKVYCMTQIGTEVYMLGKAGEGHFAGLRTMMVQDEATIDEKE
ncbi:nuclease A inhibitor family protein [Pontibacter actiniarum]|nr:nuclease A inhibitor family protein [Pontibacter actiniarum]